MFNEKLRDLKVYQNFKFSKGKKTKAGQRWVFTDKNCRCSIYTHSKKWELYFYNKNCIFTIIVIFTIVILQFLL